MVSGIEHTAIASPDPHRLAQWYVDHLGFRINYQSPTNKTTFIRAPDGSMIEIIESEGALSGVPKMSEPGIRHMALTVSDFQAAYQHLKSKGVKFLGDPVDKGGNQLIFFADADGNILHLLKRQTPMP